jgi:hypothetical protein
MQTLFRRTFVELQKMRGLAKLTKTRTSDCSVELSERSSSKLKRSIKYGALLMATCSTAQPSGTCAHVPYLEGKLMFQREKLKCFNLFPKSKGPSKGRHHVTAFSFALLTTLLLICF